MTEAQLEQEQENPDPKTRRRAQIVKQGEAIAEIDKGAKHGLRHVVR